jgi:hypothetical protein
MKKINKATVLCMLSVLIMFIGVVAGTISNKYIRIVVSIARIFSNRILNLLQYLLYHLYSNLLNKTSIHFYISN